MERELSEEQEDKAKGGDIGIGTGDIAGTNLPDAGRGAKGPDTGQAGVDRMSAAPESTGGHSADLDPSDTGSS